MKHISRRATPSRTPPPVPAARRPARRRIRVVRNQRVLVAAPARSPRCQADARRTAARLTYLPSVTPLPSRREPLLVVAPGQADRALGTDVDVLYLCTHSYPEPEPENFLDTDLADLRGVLTARTSAASRLLHSVPRWTRPCSASSFITSPAPFPVRRHVVRPAENLPVQSFVHRIFGLVGHQVHPGSVADLMRTRRAPASGSPVRAPVRNRPAAHRL